MTTATPSTQHLVAADLLRRASDMLSAYAQYCRETGISRPAAPLYDLTLFEEVSTFEGLDVRDREGTTSAVARMLAANVGVTAPSEQGEAEWWADHTRAALVAAGLLPVERECAYCGATIAEDSPGAWKDAMDDAACDDSPTDSHEPVEVDDEPAEDPDTYRDGVDGHWYVIRYDRTLPQIHAKDCDHPDHAADEEDDEPDVASLPDCGEDFMAGTICSLPAGHIERDGTSHGTTCRTCGTDWYHTGFCDCPPSDDELPAVPLDDDGARVTGFEVMAVKDDGQEVTAATESDATAWGIYVTYDGAPTMHVEDYETQEAAERIAFALAGKHDGADWRTLPA